MDWGVKEFKNTKTQGTVELMMGAHHLWSVESYKNAQQIDKQILNKSLTQIKLCYYSNR